MTNPARYPGAPVGGAALVLSLRPFGQSVMLPPAACTGPAVFGWEQEHLLGGGWTCVGFSALLPEPGSARSWRSGADRVRLARDGEGGDGAGAVRAFAGERELPVEQWHGLVFVDGSGQAEPLAGALASIEDLVAPCEPERLVIAARRPYDVAAKWKTLAENYHECCHCPSIHPELCVAGALFDWVAAHPGALRLNAWKQLERPEPAAAEMDIYRPELAALAALPGPGPLPGAAPADVLALVIGLATAWFTASPALRGLAAEPPWSPGRLAAHRAAVVAVAAALTATTPAPAS
jgi:hypothetical protein